MKYEKKRPLPSLSTVVASSNVVYQTPEKESHNPYENVERKRNKYPEFHVENHHHHHHHLTLSLPQPPVSLPNIFEDHVLHLHRQETAHGHPRTPATT